MPSARHVPRSPGDEGPGSEGAAHLEQWFVTGQATVSTSQAYRRAVSRQVL